MEQTALQNFLFHILILQLAEFSSGENLEVGDISDGKRRWREIIQLFICLKTNFCQHQAEQIPQKHIDRKSAAVDIKVITVLANLVGCKDRKQLSLSRVQIEIGNHGAGQ